MAFGSTITTRVFGVQALMCAAENHPDRGLPASPANRTLALQQICLDFRAKQARYQPRLLEFLQEHQDLLGLRGAEDKAAAYLDRVWPDNLQGTCIMANSSLGEQPQWLIRPVAEGPMAASYAAGHLGPAFRAYLGRDRLVVCGFEVTPHVPPRHFEATVSGVIRINPSDQWMSPEDLSALGSLPRQREITAARLVKWNQYLDWKEKLVQIGQGAVRYARFEMSGDSAIRFFLLGRHSVTALKRLFTNVSLLVAPLSASRSPDRWDPPPKSRIAFVKLGELISIASAHPTRASADEPALVAITVALADEDDLADALNSIPKEGFLVSNIGGDLKPLVQERRAIERLRNNQGFNPFLADCIFQIGNAAQPAVIPDVCAKYPALAGLNEEQRAAVNKAIAAVDLFLLMGPPGTGKTLVIACLCYVEALSRKRILLVSQTNLAVDGAMSRLPADAAIRPLRIAKPERVDAESQQFLEKNATRHWLTIVRQASGDHIRRHEAREDRLRRAQQGFAALREILTRVAELKANVLALEQRQVEYREQRTVHLNASSEAQDKAERLDRQYRALNELVAWLEHTESEPPAVDLLSGTPVAAELDNAVQELARFHGDGRWRLLWLDLPSSSSPASNLQVIHRVRRAIDAAGQIEAPIHEALLLCSRAEGVVVSEDTRRLRALEAEKAHLVDSDGAEDLRRLAEINREIKGLRQDHWSVICRSMVKPLHTLFDRLLPEDLDRMVSSLQPEQTWCEQLEALREFCRRLRGDGLETLQRSAARLKDQASRAADSVLAEQEVHRSQIVEAQQQADALQAEIDEADGALEDARLQLRECEQRWAELWPDVCVDLENAAVQPAMSSDVLQARQDAYSAWKEQQAPEHDRQRRWQPILREWEHRLGDPKEADQQKLRSQYARHANVVGMTCFEAGQRDFYERPEFEPFDLVICDEVSKVTPPELLTAGLLGRKLGCFGDYRQLNPMFKEHESSFEEAVAEGLLDPQDFERHKQMVTASLFQELFEAAPDFLRQSLWTTYRTHSQIMAANNQFYGGQLRCGPTEEICDQARQHHLRIRDALGGWLIEPHHHLLWIDSTRNKWGHEIFEQQRGSSKANPLEADLTVGMLLRLNAGLLERGYGPCRTAVATRAEQGIPLRHWAEGLLGSCPPETIADLFARDQIKLNGRAAGPDRLVQTGDVLELDARKPVGVITFYGAQVGEIQQRIARVSNDHPDALAALNLRCDTVDRFQGMERPIVVVSLVRALAHMRGGEYVKQYQRINVALSRAQELLVIIGSERTFRDAQIDLPPVSGGPPRKVAAYRNIWDLAGRFGGRRYANQVL